MKRNLAALTLILFLAKFGLTIVDGVCWPLSAYDMFSRPLGNGRAVVMLRAQFSDGSERDYLPWTLLPMDMYRSYQLVESATGAHEPEILGAIMQYVNESAGKAHSWRSASWSGEDPARGKKTLRSLERVEVPIETLMESDARESNAHG